jgi:hypothetical protein
MAPRRSLVPLLLVFAALLTSLCAGGGVWCSFGSKQANAANTITADTDFRAPTSSDREIGKTLGGIGGFVKPSATYNVYAQATDTGKPASGTSTVTANVSSISSGQTAAALSSGTFTFDTGSYNRRSANLTVGSGLANGTYSYSLTLTDVSGNVKTESGYTVTVDGTAPTASTISTTNKSGSIAGRPELGDTVVFTFSEPPDPLTDVTSTDAVVRIDNNATAGGNDRLQVWDAPNTTILPIGSVDLGRNDYVTTSRTFGAAGTASTAVLSGSAITVTLGTQSGAGTTAAGTGSLSWTPSSSLVDRAGNAMSTTARTETGTADKDF